MSDNTIHSPSEEDMNRVTQIFAAMRDTVIDASRLAGEVGELRRQVEAFQSEVTALRQSNHWLDQSLVEAREGRDRAKEELRFAREETAAQAEEIKKLYESLDAEMTTTNNLRAEIGILKRERDNALMGEMEAQEREKEVTAKLATVETKLADLGALFAKPVKQAGNFEQGDGAVQRADESAEAFHARRYPSEREARAAEQPREDNGRFTVEEGQWPQAAAGRDWS